MHTSEELRSDNFTITVAGEPAGIETVFPGFTEHDRLGIVIGRDWGGAGASTVILAAVTAFYDRLRASEDEFMAYPDFFAFHVGQPRGTLCMLDLWPEHKELVVDADPERILEAINDRGVTRLLVEEGPTTAGSEAQPLPEFHPYTRASAERRITTALSYSPNGRVHRPDVTIAGSARTESYVTSVLADAGPEAQSTRPVLQDNDRPVETFRRISTAQALQRLGYHMN
jgi:hypothetical protein